MVYFTSVFNAIEALSSKSFVGEDPIVVEVPIETSYAIQRLLTVAYKALFNDSKHVFQYLYEPSRITMIKTDSNHVESTVCPLFIEKLKASVRLCLTSLTLDWQEVSDKERKLYQGCICLGPHHNKSHYMIKKRSDIRMNDFEPAILITYANHTGFNDCSTPISRRAIYANNMGSNENQWVWLCGDFDKIKPFFELMRNPEGGVPSLTDMTADFLCNNMNQFDVNDVISKLPKDLIKKIKDRFSYIIIKKNE